jgi:hypothetical protein
MNDLVTEYLCWCQNGIGESFTARVKRSTQHLPCYSVIVQLVLCGMENYIIDTHGDVDKARDADGRS